MSYVQIDLARAQVAVLHNADDVLIQQAIDSAEEFACQFMNRDSIQDDPTRPWKRRPKHTTDGCGHDPVTTTDHSDPVPATVVQGILLYAADFYEHRTASSNVMLHRNPAAEALLHFYRLDIGV